MSLTPEVLRKSRSGIPQLQAIVRDQLAAINGELRRHEPSWGRNTVEYQLPHTNVGVGGPLMQQAQKFVYTAVILDLEERGFEVALELRDKNTSILYVSWEETHAREDEDFMTHTLRRVRLSGVAEVEGFRRGGWRQLNRPAPPTAPPPVLFKPRAQAPPSPPPSP